MRVLIINTSELTGGAAVAASRLQAALTHIGVEAEMLVRDRQTSSPKIHTFRGRWRMKWAFIRERLGIFFHLRGQRRGLFAIDTAVAGGNVTETDAYRRADVIHLHWINQGLLSLNELQRILRDGKAVVWTMHDIWPVTGICHLALSCTRYRKACGQCPYLPHSGSPHDLSHRIWSKKQAVYATAPMTFVACSRWLAGEARSASLTHGKTVVDIPNPIDTTVFAPRDRAKARAQLGLPTDPSLRIVLFVAQRITNLNKGMPYLVEAFRQYLTTYPEHRRDTALFILGGAAEEFRATFDIPVFTTPYTYEVDTIVNIYNAAQLFVLPSVSENLPNTIMEALSCGIPCLGFRVGGIPEMIDHGKNGYVAAAKDANDLCEGLHQMLDESNHDQLALAARTKVLDHYSFDRVGRRYLALYRQALAHASSSPSPSSPRL